MAGFTKIIMKRSETYIKSTLAYCTKCNKVEQARIVERNGKVFMERICESFGIHKIKIAADYKWYMEKTSEKPDSETIKNPKKLKLGCPNDCGICEWHSTSLHLPVFSITNDCNLNCPKCFTYNRQDKKYYKTVKDTKKIIENIVKTSSGVQLINITGGEPTLHPNLFDIIEACKNDKIGRITMNTNGLKIAESKIFAKKIKKSGVQLVLSLDTLDPKKSVLIYGKDITEEKKKALEMIEDLDIPTTLLLVCIKSINEEDVAEIAEKYIKKSFIKSITIQNMTFTGKNGTLFTPREHITIDEVENLLTKKECFSKDDFSPLASYHPLCYSIAYYVCIKNKVIPLTRILSKYIITKNSKSSYLLEPDKEFSKEFLDGLNRLWALGEDEEIVDILKKTIKDLYPQDRVVDYKKRKEFIEQMTKMIYIHPHMDEDNFDIDRVSRCGDLVPDELGNMIPACSYNLLYRKKDPRFWEERNG